MSNPKQPTPDHAATPNAGAANPSRRRFTKAGLAGSGMILTLASKQVIAGGTSAACESPSGFSSINTSAPGQTNTVCSGLTPGYWKNHTPWPSPYQSGKCSTEEYNSTCKSYDSSGTQFHAVFPPGPYCTNFGTTTMMNVMWLGGDVDKYEMGAHMGATALNIASGKIPSTVLNNSTLLAIWTAYASTGYYSPTPGVKWDGTAIVSYLKSTMPV